MANTFYSKAVYISGNGPIIGHSCPGSKRDLIKSINVNNESSINHRGSVYWNDGNNINIGKPTPYYPIRVSGEVLAFDVLRATSDFFSLRAGDAIVFYNTSTGFLTATISYIEQDA